MRSSQISALRLAGALSEIPAHQRHQLETLTQRELDDGRVHYPPGERLDMPWHRERLRDSRETMTSSAAVLPNSVREGSSYEFNAVVLRPDNDAPIVVCRAVAGKNKAENHAKVQLGVGGSDRSISLG